MGATSRAFLPSAHGCTFGNAQTHRLPIVIAGRSIARVTGGLCGGMVLDSLRAWKMGTQPATLSDVTRVFAAQLRSFQAPSAPVRYLRLQRPGARRLRRSTTERARHQIAQSLTRGEPVPVALVCALSPSPLALTAHHVVLAYRLIEHDDRASVLAIYDPNHPGDDTIRLRLSRDGCAHSRGRQVHAAFALTAR